jgi:hypothetical protein
MGIDAVVNFLGRFPHQEQPAGDEDQIAPRELRLERRLPVRAGRALPAEIEHRRRQSDQPGNARQQYQPHAQRQPDADSPRATPPLRRQLVGQYRDEDQVVDAEHDFHDDQRHQRRPCAAVRQQARYRLHLPLPCVRAVREPQDDESLARRSRRKWLRLRKPLSDQCPMRGQRFFART